MGGVKKIKTIKGKDLYLLLIKIWDQEVDV